MRRVEEQALARLAAADPARALRVGPAEVELALGRVLAAVAREDGVTLGEGDVGPGVVGGNVFRVLVLAVLAALVLAAVALAATGAFRAGAPVRRSYSLIGRAGQDLGKVVRSELLPVSTPDPYGGPPWGVRVVYTSRGVGCLEVGRMVEGRLGALGIDGAFKDDRRFHELRPGRLSGGGTCGNLDGHGLLFDIAAEPTVPASGPQLPQSCVAPPSAGDGYSRLPAGGVCPTGGMRQLYYGLLGPDARSLTYRAGRAFRRLSVARPDGAFLIVLPATSQSLRHAALGTGGVDMMLPRSWLAPIASIAYSTGEVCHIARFRPGLEREPCPIPGYTALAARTLGQAQVASPLHVAVVHGEGSRREIEVSLIARVGSSSVREAYELTEDTSSPQAVFSATQRDIKPGERVAFHLWALAPGTYSGTVVYTNRAPASYGAYMYGRGPLVGRFRITLRGGTYPCWPRLVCPKARRGR
jgi:hypothetical protein